MEKYFGSVITQTGTPIVGAVVTVTHHGTGLPATIYSDDGITPISGQLLSDATGFYEFFIAPGHYNLTYTLGGDVVRTILDVTIGDDEPVIVNVKDYGAVGDGVADDLAAMEAARDRLVSLGGGVIYFPAGIYGVKGCFSINDNNITLEGDGGGWDQPGITTIRASAATRIVWIGAASSSAVVEFTSLAGGLPKVGGGIRKIMIDGGMLADQCLSVRSFRALIFQQMMLYAAVDLHLFTGSITGALSHAPYDVQRCLFDTVTTSNRNLTAPTTASVVLTGAQGNGGTASGNTSFNTFINSQFSSNGAAYDLILEGTDNNYFYNTAASKVMLSSSDQDLSGTGTTFARHNQFHGCEFGTTDCKASQTGGFSSQKNLFIGHARSNGASLPTFQTGAGGAIDANGLVISTSSEFVGRPLFRSKMAIGDNVTQTNYAEALAATLAIGNGASNHVSLTNGTEAWGININASNGNLRFIRSAGTGMVFIDSDVQLSGKFAVNGSTPPTKPTVTGSRGGNAALASLLTALASYGLITDGTS